MCGIFGWYDKSLSSEARATLTVILSYFNSYRGTDSWGIARVFRGKRQVERGLGDISASTRPREMGGKAKLLLGHTRLATVGAVNLANAHPFDYKGALVAHNGAVYNHGDLAAKDGRIYTVDSQALAWRIAAQQATKDVRGYGAVTWLDASNRLFVSRLTQGDLCLFHVKHGKGSAYGFTSSWQSGTWLPKGQKRSLSLLETLELYGFHVDKLPLPDTGAVHQLTARGFVTHTRRLDLKTATSWSSYRYRSSWSDEDDAVTYSRPRWPQVATTPAQPTATTYKVPQGEPPWLLCPDRVFRRRLTNRYYSTVLGSERDYSWVQSRDWPADVPSYLVASSYRIATEAECRDLMSDFKVGLFVDYLASEDYTKTSPGEAELVGHCQACGDNLYASSVCHVIDGTAVCRHCHKRYSSCAS
jgi:hypothetical protein